MSDGARIRPMGDRALLVELRDNDEVHRVAAHARAAHGDALCDVVAGHRTVLLVWPRPPADRALADAVIAGADERGDAGAGEEIVVPTVYDGPDLGDVARLAGVSPEEVVRRHQDALYRVAFIGFAPGFGYLLGGDFDVPRREDPRERVPAGSVALAGAYAAVYPSASPGGWQLIGRTDLRVFDPAREPPALLEPGGRVRFVEAS